MPLTKVLILMHTNLQKNGTRSRISLGHVLRKPPNEWKSGDKEYQMGDKVMVKLLPNDFKFL